MVMGFLGFFFGEQKLKREKGKEGRISGRFRCGEWVSSSATQN